MTTIVLLLAILALVALLAAAGAFAWFIFRLSSALPQRIDELRDRIDAIRAVAELRDQVQAIDRRLHDGLSELRETVETLDRFGANLAENHSRDAQTLDELEEHLQAVDMRLQRAIASIAGAGLVRFDDREEVTP